MDMYLLMVLLAVAAIAYAFIGYIAVKKVEEKCNSINFDPVETYSAILLWPIAVPAALLLMGDSDE